MLLACAQCDTVPLSAFCSLIFSNNAHVKLPFTPIIERKMRLKKVSALFSISVNETRKLYQRAYEKNKYINIQPFSGIRQ